VDVKVLLGRQRSLVLPESAVSGKEGSVVVMAVAGGVISYKRVVPGVRFDGKVEILEGITPEDDIVVSGRSEITEGPGLRRLLTVVGGQGVFIGYLHTQPVFATMMVGSLVLFGLISRGGWAWPSTRRLISQRQHYHHTAGRKSRSHRDGADRSH